MSAEESFQFLAEALATPMRARQLFLNTADETGTFALSSEFVRLTRLESLCVDGMAKRIGNAAVLRRLPRLRVLSLEYRLVAVPSELGALVSLEELRLRGHFASLPKQLARMASLRRLELISPKLKALPTWLGDLSELREIHAPHCGLSVIPKALGRLSKLEVLDLTGNAIRALPDELRRCTALRRLQLRNTKLKRLPEWLAELASLEALDVAENPALRNVPASLTRLVGANLEVSQLEPAARASRTKEKQEAFARFERAAQAKERPAFLPVLRKRADKKSHLGGTPWLAKGEDWPTCAICGERMPLWIQLFADDAPRAMRRALDGATLQWFHCHNEPSIDRLVSLRKSKPELLEPSYVQQLDELVARAGMDLLHEVADAFAADGAGLTAELQRKLHKKNASESYAFFLMKAPCHYLASSAARDVVEGPSFQLARIVDVGRLHKLATGPAAPNSFGPLFIVDWKRVVDRPRPLELGLEEWWEPWEQLDEKQRRRVELEWNLQKDKLGGWPSWFQSDDCETCPECGAEMRQLLFQVDTGYRSSIPWGSSGIAFLMQCPKHPRELRAMMQTS
jgi:hypothetical protein